MSKPFPLLKSTKTVAMFVLPPLVATAFALPALFSLPALADPLNPQEPQFQMCHGATAKDWGNQKDVEQLIIDKGFELINIRIEKGCWEVKAINAQDEIYEFYIHPVSHEVIMSKRKLGEPIDQNTGQPTGQ